MSRRLSALLLAAALGAPGCTRAAAEDRDRAPSAIPAPPAPSAPPPAPPPARVPIDGRAFPDKVLALTWDDGPDTGTLALARYLRAQGVSATFFVVGAWIEGLSDEPGQGRGVLETGHQYLPVLGDLVALGHRVANHTLNHVVLADAPAATVVRQLRENQERIEPFQKGSLHLFRAPGGAWSAAASAAVDADPTLARLVGPVHWDIDRKDWEGSLYCRSSLPATECERAAPGGALRVKASVTAKRYLAGVESAGHGIVLMHDRVGHVGSDYALRVAEGVIPELKARGYVFAAPVLRFSPPAPAGTEGEALWERARAAGTLGRTARGDINGDGREDECTRGPEGVVCALSDGRSLLQGSVWLAATDEPDGAIVLGDVNGDGRADLCMRGREGVVCALAP